MLEQIVYQLPQETPTEATFVTTLLEMLSDVTPQPVAAKDATYGQVEPNVTYSPQTLFTATGEGDPRVTLLPMTGASSLILDNLGINPQALKHSRTRIPLSIPNYHCLDIHAVARVLKGHLRRLDHTGINLPAAQISKEQWCALLRDISAQANLYEYPENPDWAFLIPSTREELVNEITDFSKARCPKFELVYDKYESIPTLQIDIETDLSQEETENLFPDPYGISLQGLETFFRTIFVKSPWPNLLIRLDLRFPQEDSAPWTSGSWLVQEGVRIHPASYLS